MLMESLEDRRMFSGGGYDTGLSSLVAAALSYRILSNTARTLQATGPSATSLQLGQPVVNGLNNAMRAGGLSSIGNMTSLQALPFTLNNLPISSYYRDPQTGFNVVTDIGPGFTSPVYTAVANNIAQNFSHGATNMDYVGVLNHYGLTNVPGSGYAGQSALLNLGVVQYGTSFLARLPNGQMAHPSDFGLPYSNSGVFNPGAINYGNVYSNPWNTGSW